MVGNDADSHWTKAACIQISRIKQILIDKYQSGNQEFFVTTVLSRRDLGDCLVNH
jgi:hypothetical protein